MAWILALVVVAGAAVALWYFVLRDGGGGGGSARLAASVVPASADTVAGIDAGTLLTSPEFAKLAQLRGIDIAAVKAKLAEVGIKPEDVKSVVVAADVPDAGEPEVVIAVELNADTKAAQGAVLALQAMLPEGLGKRLDLSKVEAFEGGLVLAGSGAIYDEAAKLARGQGTAGALAPALLEMRDAVDAGAHIWASITLPKALTERGLPGPARQVFGDAKPTHAAFSVRLGSTIELKGALRLEGGDASKIADKLGSLLGFASMGVGDKGVSDVLNALDIGSKGSALTLSVALTPEQLEKVSKSSPF